VGRGKNQLFGTNKEETVQHWRGRENWHRPLTNKENANINEKNKSYRSL
jgi:hypothetical protein